MKRRDYIKSLALLPLAGTSFPIQSAFGNTTESPIFPDLKDEPQQNIFRSIGVEPIINCQIGRASCRERV